MIKHILFSISVFAALSTQAQIFINSGKTTSESTTNKKEIKGNSTVTGTTVTGKTTSSSAVKANKTTTDIKGTNNSSYTKPSSTASYSSKNTNTSTFAGSDVPPNAKPGKCYARCQTEDQYTFKTKQVVSTPQMIKRIKLPALYTTIYDTIITRPRSVRYENVPAQYETIKEQKMTAPATTKWVKGKADKGCLSADPNDCQVMCLVEVPAQYTVVSKRVLKQEAYKKEIAVPMEYRIVAKQVLTQPESYTEQVIPATYKTVQERVLVSKGGYQGWREILCGSDLTTAKISQIQAALRAAGYKPGPVDNVFGTQTKEALKAFQRANGLPVGNLNFETLRALGVK